MIYLHGYVFIFLFIRPRLSTPTPKNVPSFLFWTLATPLSLSALPLGRPPPPTPTPSDRPSFGMPVCHALPLQAAQGSQ